MKDTKDISLEMEHLSRKLDEVKSFLPLLNSIAKGSEEMRNKVTSEITKFAMSIRSMKLIYYSKERDRSLTQKDLLQF